MPTADPTPRTIHLLSAVIVLAAFLAGAAAGVGFYRWAGPERRPGPPRGAPSPLPPHLAGLGLSAEQAAQAERIVERHRPALDAVLRESYPRMQAIVGQMHAEVRAILTPEQRRRFDDLVSRAPPWAGPGGPAPGPPGMPPPGPPPGPPPEPPPR